MRTLFGTGKPLSEGRTPLADFFSILLEGREPDTGETLVTRSVMEMDDRTSDVSPWDVSQWTVIAIILRARNRGRMKTVMFMKCERLNERRYEIRRAERAESCATEEATPIIQEKISTGIAGMF